MFIWIICSHISFPTTLIALIIIIHTYTQKLEECQLQIQCLHNECSASERNASQTQSKIDRTLEALKIAGANAANARAEADAANARV